MHYSRTYVVDGMVWYGMVWYGVVWHGMVWYGMACCSMVWYGMLQYGVVWYGVVWYGMVWYGMVWHGMAWYGMVWHGGLGTTRVFRHPDVVIWPCVRVRNADYGPVAVEKSPFWAGCGWDSHLISVLF